MESRVSNNVTGLDSLVLPAISTPMHVRTGLWYTGKLEILEVQLLQFQKNWKMRQADCDSSDKDLDKEGWVRHQEFGVHDCCAKPASL